MKDINIRPARPDDRALLLDLLTLFQDDERAIHPNRRPGVEIAEAAVAEIERDNGAHNGITLIAERDGEVVGFVACHDGHDDALIYEALRDHGYVSDIFVRHAHRGHGVGSALLDAAEDYLAKRGFIRVRLWVLVDNSHSRAIYEKRGYRGYEMIYEKDLGKRAP
ncbi:MAG: GNAT family N-acetyltransferase [Alphaproteobacteria bacterium]